MSEPSTARLSGAPTGDLPAHDEPLLVRFVGGPLDGQTRQTLMSLAGWPLPERHGEYVKVRESQLPSQEAGSPIIRGAEYEWHQ